MKDQPNYSNVWIEESAEVSKETFDKLKYLTKILTKGTKNLERTEVRLGIIENQLNQIISGYVKAQNGRAFKAPQTGDQFRDYSPYQVGYYG